VAFIPVNDVCQAELIYTWESQTIETVLHFLPEGAMTPIIMTELGAHLKNWWDTLIRPGITNAISLVNIKLTDLSTEVAPVVNYATGLPLVGGAIVAALPNNCAMVITKRTLLRGKSYRGRIYHPALSETVVTGNTIAGGTVNALVGHYSQLLAFTTTTASWEMVVVSRYSNNQPRPSGIATPVISLDSNGTVDSQRRRLPSRGS